MCQRGSLVNFRCLRVSDERVGHEGKVSDGKQQQVLLCRFFFQPLRGVKNALFFAEYILNVR